MKGRLKDLQGFYEHVALRARKETRTSISIWSQSDALASKCYHNTG